MTSDLAGAIAGMGEGNSLRTGKVTAVRPLKVNVGGGEVLDAGTLASVKVGDTVSCLRQGQTWLVLGVVQAASATDLQKFNGSVDIAGSAVFSAPPSAGSNIVKFNHGYGIWVDNLGAGGNATRMWIDTPDLGEVIIGPRNGALFLGQFRVRTNDTTALASNTVLDGDILKKSTSSLRYKVNVEDADFNLDQLAGLRPVRFQDRAEHAEQGDGSRQYVGLIAEEVDALGFQEFVFYDAEGRPDGVQYDRLTVALLDIVKDLAARVAALEEGI